MPSLRRSEGGDVPWSKRATTTYPTQQQEEMFTDPNSWHPISFDNRQQEIIFYCSQLYPGNQKIYSIVVLALLLAGGCRGSYRGLTRCLPRWSVGEYCLLSQVWGSPDVLHPTCHIICLVPFLSSIHPLSTQESTSVALCCVSILNKLEGSTFL